MSSKIVNYTLSEIRHLLATRQVSPRDVCEACLKRIKATSELNAFITVVPPREDDLTLLLKEKKDGRLQGIPVAIKDNFSTSGILTTCASHTLETYVPPYTATVVERLVGNGVVVVGKTNLDEFAMGSGNTDSIFGPVRNPWRYKWSHQTAKDKPHQYAIMDDRLSDTIHVSVGVDRPTPADEVDFYIPGGSSGGSAVAVATGSVFAALGSDTAGSTRIPAAFCGVTALKPTYGLLSRHGLISLTNSMDVPGIMALCVDDVAEVLNATAGWDKHDSTTVTDTFTPVDLSQECDVRGLHIGLPKEFDNASLSPDVSSLWRDTAAILTHHGAKVSWVSLPHSIHNMTCYHILACCEIASNFARYDGLQFGLRAQGNTTEELYAQSRHQSFSDTVRGRILAGNYFLLKDNYEKYFVHAQKVRRLISNDYTDVFTRGVDILLTPATPFDAPLYSDFIKGDNRAMSAEIDLRVAGANLAGLPSVVIPCKLSTNHLPIAMQLISPSFTEQSLLSAAKFIESQMRFEHLNLDFLDD